VLIPFLLIFHSCSKYDTSVQSRNTDISLNGTWRFRYFPGSDIGDDSLFHTPGFDVSGWENITVPGHWELQGFAEPSYKMVKEGTGLYYRTFSVPETWKDKLIFIRFEGVLYGYELFVNGKFTGAWAGSFLASEFDITRFITYNKENILTVKVITHPKGFEFDLFDCWALSGIFREVVLSCKPPIHIKDYTVQTFIKSKNRADVSISVEIGQPEQIMRSHMQLRAVLTDPKGNTVERKKVHLTGSKIYKLHFNVRNPYLWTAETPFLYKLNLLLVKDKEKIQEEDQMVGIREITIEDAVLKLNGRPVKLHGVNHHDLLPHSGKTFTPEEITRDFSLIKKANINFIRTSHYPPDRRVLDLCDSMGFYVACEIPISDFGEKHLSDSSYLDILMNRAKATLKRDKNHPSIIIWSLGNEYAMTPITEIPGRYVQKNDSTRPICYPQGGYYFEANYKTLPEFPDILAPHYKSATWISEFAKETHKPVIMTEFAHAQGLSFGNLEDIWDEMFRNESLAGGAVWVFQDQGLLRKANQAVNVKEPTPYAWVDSVHYFDTYGVEGVDGIVYADRTPQPDYWQVRKVFSPVQIIERELQVKPGKQVLALHVFNQYDFLNLNSLTGKWSLCKNRDIIQEKDLEVNCNSHDTVKIKIPVTLPNNPGNDIYILRLEFSDKELYTVYEHSIRLLTTHGYHRIKEQISNEIDPGKFIYELGSDKIRLQTGEFNYEIDPDKFIFRLLHRDGKSGIIERLLARTGRNIQIVDESIVERHFPQNGDYFWKPFLLDASGVKYNSELKEGNEYRFSVQADYFRGDNFPGQKLEGNIECHIRDNGILVLTYSFIPVNTTGVFLEAGISFILSESCTDFQWLGDGPYASYPDKYKLNDFGFHYMKKGDIHFNGNRSNVEIAVITDIQGNGIAVMGDKSNISVEVQENRVVLSHNALLTGLSNKKTLPQYLVKAAELKEIRGSMEIIPLRKNNWPEKLRELFPPDPEKKPYMPFYHCYDYSR